MILNLILGSALALMIILYIILYKKVNDIIVEFKKPIRYGYIKRSLTYGGKNVELSEKFVFEPLVFVKEVDRFTNGESKIELDRIEVGADNNKVPSKDVEKYLRDEFKSVVNTADVIWLESEQSIKDIRRNKLERLKKIK